jgi:mannose-6-phosphate isomerase-like protein (cupin superfamily)
MSSRCSDWIASGSLIVIATGLMMAGIRALDAQVGQGEADVPFASSAAIDAAVARVASGTDVSSRFLPDGAYQYFVTSRKQPGSAEIHTRWTDITIIKSGTGILRTGRTIAGRRETSSGEWRGNAIDDANTRRLGVGDFVVIRAGVAHQFSPTGNRPLVYVTVKVPAAAGEGRTP